MTEALINVKQVWKEYDDLIVLEQLSLDVKEGEFCTLVGASGCGKTTFLRMLLGEEKPTRGSISLAGESLPAEPGKDRGIVFQRYSVFPHLTVFENVLLGLELERSQFCGKLFGKRKRQASKEVRAMIDSVGLGAAMDKYPSALSGGMQQRLAIAQSLIKKPRILLLDEPFGALDPGIRADMHELILSLWHNTKTTIFMVTHDLHEGFYLGTRLLVFDKIRQDEQYPNRFGASITYDIPLGVKNKKLLDVIESKTSLSDSETRQPVILPYM